MQYKENSLLKNSVSLEAVRKDQIYHNASMRFNAIISIIEDKLDEKDRILTAELIYNKILMEVAAANIMYKQGLIKKEKRSTTNIKRVKVKSAKNN